MGSLKHLLIDVDDDDRQGFSSTFGPRSEYCDTSALSNVPLLDDPSWPALWSGFFNSDIAGADLYHDSGDPDWSQADVGIETWATENLPLESLLLTPPDSIEASVSSQIDADEQICYGMIYRAAVKLIGEATDIEGTLKDLECGHDSAHFICDITKNADELLLIFPNGIEFALLCKQTTKALETIIDLPSVQVEAIADLVNLRDTVFAAKNAKDTIFRVNINIYGLRQIQAEIGKHLSKSKAFLQHPDHVRPGTAYENPHFIALPGITLPTTQIQTQDAHETAPKGDHEDNFQKAVADVFSSLKRSSHLQGLEGDRRLKTTLLPHQKEGLDFMMQRETGPVPEEFSLWRATQLNGRQCFCHTITKTELRSAPPETGGGVLADEMGMGKSLAILSLVARTLNSASDWVHELHATPSVDLNAKKTRSRATLVVVSSGLLLNSWLAEIEKHLDGTFAVTKYHGQRREERLAVLADSDVVLTTYHTLAADFAAKKSPVHNIAWFRIVLDEAHIIRRRATFLYKTVFDLIANFRWCLTGSPIQNMLEDIGALFTFIKAAPFDNIATFRHFIVTPFLEEGERRTIASERLSRLLDSVCLRRTRDLIHLPDLREVTRSVELSSEEHIQYNTTKKTMIQALRHKVGEADKKHVFGMFQAQLQLRILANHGTYQQLFSWTDPRNLQMEQEDALCAVGQNGEIVCSRCRQAMPLLGTNRVTRKYSETCAHVLCSECMEEKIQEGAVDSHLVFKCPLCYPIGPGSTKRAIDTDRAAAGERNDKYFRPCGYSSKMAAIVEDVREDLWQTKSIIFSCWTRTLDLVGRHLRQSAIPYERIDGECPLPRRQQILDDFSINPRIPVLIMTTGVGAFGYVSLSPSHAPTITVTVNLALLLTATLSLAVQAHNSMLADAI
jgi:SWI/SNF-related matrix-associated actin-dependent regulator of chromatin subfamily A3